MKTDSEALNQTYARFAQHTHGAVLRDELAWNEYWLWDPDDIMAAIYYNEQTSPTDTSSTGSPTRSFTSRT